MSMEGTISLDNRRTFPQTLLTESITRPRRDAHERGLQRAAGRYMLLNPPDVAIAMARRRSGRM
jgi:hypothetical protein